MTRIVLQQAAMPNQFMLLQQDNAPVQFLLSNTGPRGLKGNDGSRASISTDADNAIALGSDEGLFVPTVIDAGGGLDLTLIFDNQII